MITARVHPGETPASHVLRGILDVLTREGDPRTDALLRHFVFKIIPVLNPDGVANGHYRADSQGLNLNRCYADPSPEVHPTVFAARRLVMHHAAAGSLGLYLDLHAHINKRGCFLFGNFIEDAAR